MASKHFIIPTVFILLFVSCKCNKEKAANNEEQVIAVWNDELTRRQIENRENPDTWDMKIFEQDMNFKNKHPELEYPVMMGIFPEPHYYNLVKNSFTGLGNWGWFGDADSKYEIDGNTILYNAFYTLRNAINAPYIGDKENEVFFQIIWLTNYVDTINYSHYGDSEIRSRNNPDVMAQGNFFPGDNLEVKYIAFLAANRDSYAIVNTRLFNLQYGHTILIAPQKDGSLRSMQIESPLLSQNELCLSPLINWTNL